jgi:hypothetical protein
MGDHKGRIGRSRRVARAFLIVLAAAAGGCVTTEDETADPHKPTHYTLRRGPTAEHAAPLPAQTDVLVDWHYANGDRKTQTGFRGWDMDGDGRFELLEVLGPDGQVQARVYDFDGDGEIDLKK